MSDVIQPFIQFPDPRLSQAATPRAVDDELRETGRRLHEAATEAKAYGLAAAHIGKVLPVAVISVSDPETRDYRVLFNPRVISAGTEQVTGPEGSVSMPGIEVAVTRSVQATIAFHDEAGTEHVLELSGFAARVAQHEIDQVNGVFFLSRVSRLKRDAAVRRFEKLERRPV